MVGLLIGVIGIAFCLKAWRLRHHPPRARPADIPRGLFWGAIALLALSIRLVASAIPQ